MRFEFALSTAWPSLAWLARCVPGDDVVSVTHGARVEVAPDWFCEAVWAGNYDDGGFDRTDLVFGSGGRARGKGITFVSSGATVDRLQVLETSGGVLISNSLPCLLAAAAGEVDPVYPHYFRDFSSIRLGVSRFAPLLATSAGPVRLVYFRNVTWDGQRLESVDKPHPVRDFGTFERYRGFLETSLQRIGANLSAPARGSPLRFLGTISSGYDSPTATVLARGAGLAEVISFGQSPDAGGDSGRDIAARVGLEVRLFARDNWRGQPFAEVPFLAADAKGEDVYFASAQSTLAGRVLLTGFHGDKIWGKYTTALTPDLVRGDQSGLSLTEYRLRAGFLHCPVPFMGVRQIRDVNSLSRSPALARWDVSGDYTRPICRRIVEEAGVPRQAFGVEKKASSVLFFNRASFLTADALAEYVPWVEAHVNGRRRAERWDRAVRGSAARAARLVQAVAGAGGSAHGLVARAARRLAGWADREPLFRWLYPWATERAKAAYTREDVRQ